MAANRVVFGSICVLVLAACGNSNNEAEQALSSTWDLPNGGADVEVPVLQPRTRIANSFEARDAALSPDGSQLALARIVGSNTDDTLGTVVSIYDTVSGALLQELETSSIDDLGRHSLVWSTDNRVTLFGTKNFVTDRWLSWDPVTAEEIGERVLSNADEPCDEFGFFMSINPGRNLLVHIEKDSNNISVICRFDLENLVVDASEELGLPGFVNSPVFSPDGQQMALSWFSSTSSNVGVLGTRLVDSDTLQYTGEEYPAEEGKIAVLGDDFHIGLQEPDSGGELRIFPGRTPIDSSFGTILSDPGARVLSSRRPDYTGQGDDFGTRLITLPDGIVIGDVFETEPDLRTFSADGSTIAVANGVFVDVYALESVTTITALPVERNR